MSNALKIEKNTSPAWRRASEKSGIIEDLEGNTVAFIATEFKTKDDFHQQANMIAAAPELLKFLEAAVDMIDSFEQREDPAAMESWELQQMRAVIKKARGLS